MNSSALDIHRSPVDKTPHYVPAPATLIAICGCLILLAICGGIVSCIWLAVKGEGVLIFVGIFCSLLMPLIFSIAVWPTQWLANLLYGDRTPSWLKIATIGFPCALWFSALVVSWTFTTFWNFMQCGETGLIIPLLLWGYAVTMTPLVSMAIGEEEITIGRVFFLILAALTYATLTILFLAGVNEQTMIVTIATLATIEAILRTVVVGVSTISPQRKSEPQRAAPPFPSSEEKAVDIVAEFGDAFAMCNEERLLFKPQSLLAYDLETVVHAMKLAYQSGYPLPDELERAYLLYFPQMSFFIQDDHFDRVSAYFERSVGQLKKVCPKRASLDYYKAMCTVNCAPITAIYSDEFFEREFLVDAPPDSDKEWVQQLTRNCWQHFRRRIAEWEEFVALVETANSGLEPRELALAET